MKTEDFVWQMKEPLDKCVAITDRVLGFKRHLSDLSEHLNEVRVFLKERGLLNT